jgi:uncharacterized protein involved in type VI secretion and phage assembly
MRDEVIRIRCSKETKLKWMKLAADCRILRKMSAEELLSYLMNKYGQFG